MGELVKPSVVAEILKRHGMRLTRSLGQNFLIDGNTLRRILRAADLGSADTVLEIGPGIGTLTEELCDRAGRVVAIEMDPRLVAILAETLGDRRNLEVVEGDAMRVDLQPLFREDEPVKVVSNLPYNVATPLMLRLLRELPQVKSMTLTVQRELADRYTASPGNPAYGGVSAKICLLAEARRIASIPPTVFLPQPRVDSCIIRIERKGAPATVMEIDSFFHFINAAFAKRRKMLVNALGSGRAPYCPRTRVEAALQKGGFPPSSRAEELSSEELLLVFRHIQP
jgi:16S rRNA (adenine1518-N6/adenine1519-N6)-dimethyltransferase